MGLIVNQPEPTIIKLSPTSYYWASEARSFTNKTLFISIGTCYAAAMLLFATFLAYKTRSADRSYDQLNECKQMCISVYNILLSAMINSLINYSAKFDPGALTTLRAAKFVFVVLFIPKLLSFYKQRKKPFVSSISRQLSDGSDHIQQTVTGNNETLTHSFLKSNKNKNDADHNAGTEAKLSTSYLLFEQAAGDTPMSI